MKKINFSSFVAGIVFSAAILTVFAFTQKAESKIHVETNLSGVASLSAVITPAQALQYRSNYTRNFPASQQAINISKQQLDAINQTVTNLGDQMRNVSGFRLYFGSLTADPESQVVSLAYSINSNLVQNAPGETLQMADGFNRAYAQQCPPFCD